MSRGGSGGRRFVRQTHPGGGPRLSLESLALLLGSARIESPLKTVDFLDAYPDILGRRFEGSSPEDLLDSSGKCTPCPASRCAVPGGKQPIALPPHSSTDDSSTDTSLCPALTPTMERRELAPHSLECRLPPAPLPHFTVSGQGETSQKEQGWSQPRPSLPCVNDV